MAFRKLYTISDESLNSYGFWILTSGAKLDNFKNNAPCFYDHNTWELPIGHWENVRVEGSELKAELVIDGKNEIEKEIIRKIENGDLKGASIGFDVLAYSEESQYLKAGQKRPTVVAFEPYEASVTPLPSNSNATMLLSNRKNGIQLRATEDSDDINKILPNILNTKSIKKMDKIALALGLPTDAAESTILDALKIVLSKSSQTDTLSSHVEDLAKEALNDEQHKFFTELNKTNPAQALDFLKLHKKTEAVVEEKTETTKPNVAAAKLSDVLKEVKKLSKGESTDEDDKETFDWLQKNNPKKLIELKRNDPAKFKEMEDAYVLSKQKK